MKRNNIERSRQLRKDQTDTEGKPWSILRNRQLSGVKFRRQFPIGRYILDFYCPEYKLGIEADGGGHYDDNGKRQDEVRTKMLSRYGVRIIRFSDSDMLNNIEDVHEAICKEIEDSFNPSPCPLPASRGEG